MNRFKLFLALACLCLFTITSCKKKGGDNGGGDDNSGVSSDPAVNITSMLNTTENAGLQYQEALQAGGDSVDAFLAMGKWLLEQNEVDHVDFFDIGTYHIYYKSGLMAIMDVIPAAADGHQLIRGGGNGSGYGSLARTSADEHIIENKKVLIFSPFNKEFYYDNYPHLADFSGKIALEPTLVANEQADLSVINTFKDYGFIILNTHGHPQGFSIKSKVPQLSVPHTAGSSIYTADFVRSMFVEGNNMPMDKFISGDLLMCVTITRAANGDVVYLSGNIVVTDKYIRQIPKLDKAVVYGNFCYSGWTADGPNNRNMLEAMKSIGAISYYGYAYPDGSSSVVDDRFAQYMEDTLIKSLVGGDSTGVAHLKNNTDVHSDDRLERVKPKDIALTKEMTRGMMLTASGRDQNTNEPLFFYHYADPTYKYDGCGTYTDDRDGEKYKLVCIGNKKWFAENLRYAGAGVCYDNNSTNCDKYGRLYTYAEAMNGKSSAANPSGVQGICPKNTHIPSQAEWDELFDAVGGKVQAQDKLRSTTGWPTPNQNTDAIGFNMLPGGGYSYRYTNMDTAAYFWTSDAYSSGGYYGINAYYPGLNATPYVNSSPQVWKFSCRCVVD